ncbi:cell division protein SepF [Streptomyces fractus]|uniref:cell division protein SepF n=1 Tax=Streptomyces fractus TaxID=641806 RepID=UPI003CEBA855
MSGGDEHGETGGADGTDAQWKGLAEVVPLRGDNEWPSWPSLKAETSEHGQSRRKLALVRVGTFADARTVAEYLMAEIPVLLDLNEATPDVARRALDFVTGIIFGLNGTMHRVDKRTFVLAPPGTEVASLGKGKRADAKRGTEEGAA